jgi:transcriptional regulator with XRE-family HTH domain
MIKYTVGEVIRRERKAQKISQEELADGICTPSWLSKIESGACIPTNTMFECLMQRLGKSASQYVYYKSDIEMEIDQLKFRIRRHTALKEVEEAKSCFEQFKLIIREEYKLDQQFKLLYEVLLGKEKNEEDLEAQLAMLEQALAYSIPKFSLEKINTYLLNQEEIVILNNMANILYKLGNRKRAIEYLSKLKFYLENPKFDYEEKNRSYPIVLCNLSKLQGLDGDYHGCVATCDAAIAFCIKASVLTTFGDVLFNKGYALAELESFKLAEQYMRQAYYVFKASQEVAFAESVQNYALSKLDKDISI